MTDISKTNYPICPVRQLAHAECFEFTLPENLTNQNANIKLLTAEAFVLNWHDNYHAYLNSCPHTHVNLNWRPNQFFDLESQFIQCSLHGAVFEPQSGLCLRGPCLGESLLSLPTIIQDDVVTIDLNALNSGQMK